MDSCSFCGAVIERGTGKLLVQRDGSILHFCSNKCEKNLLKLKRNPIKVRWTLKYRKFKGKTITEAVPEKGKGSKVKEKEKVPAPPKEKEEKSKPEKEEKKEEPKEEKKEEKK